MGGARATAKALGIGALCAFSAGLIFMLRQRSAAFRNETKLTEKQN